MFIKSDLRSRLEFLSTTSRVGVAPALQVLVYARNFFLNILELLEHILYQAISQFLVLGKPDASKFPVGMCWNPMSKAAQ